MSYCYNVCAVSYVLPYRPRLTLPYSHIILMLNSDADKQVFHFQHAPSNWSLYSPLWTLSY